MLCIWTVSRTEFYIVDVVVAVVAVVAAAAVAAAAVALVVANVFAADVALQNTGCPFHCCLGP